VTPGSEVKLGLLCFSGGAAMSDAFLNLEELIEAMEVNNGRIMMPQEKLKQLILDLSKVPPQDSQKVAGKIVAVATKLHKSAGQIAQIGVMQLTVLASVLNNRSGDFEKAANIALKGLSQGSPNDPGDAGCVGFRILCLPSLLTKLVS